MVPDQHPLSSTACSGTCWGLHRQWCTLCSHQPSPADSAQAKIQQLPLGIQPTRSTMVFIISVLDLETKKHMRLPRGCSCLSCPRFSNLEALPLPEAPAVLAAAQTQQHPESWAGVTATPLPGEPLPGGTVTSHPEELPSETSSWRKGLCPSLGRAGGMQLNLPPAQTHRCTDSPANRGGHRELSAPLQICCPGPGCRHSSSTQYPAQPPEANKEAPMQGNWLDVN